MSKSGKSAFIDLATSLGSASAILMASKKALTNFRMMSGRSAINLFEANREYPYPSSPHSVQRMIFSFCPDFSSRRFKSEVQQGSIDGMAE